MSLFSESSGSAGGRGGQAAAAPEPKVLRYKMGRMEVASNGTTVTPLPDKGELVLREQEGLKTLVWRNRTTGAEEEPSYVFPDDQVFRMCRSAPASSRVFYLKIQPDRRLFYWMQEPDASKDLQFCKDLNVAMNGSDTTTPESKESDDTVPMSEQSQPSTTNVSGQNAGAQLDEGMMRNILSGLASEAQRQRPLADLTEILAPSNVEALLGNPDVVQRLLPLLPESSNATVADLRANIRSPQYQQALASFTMALNSGDLDAAMGQFGVDPSVAAQAGGGAVGLSEAISQQEGEQSQSSSADAKQDDEPKPMDDNLD